MAQDKLVTPARPPRERNTYVAALTGAHMLHVPGKKKRNCHSAGIWLLSGDGWTAGKTVSGTPRKGTEVIDINDHVCHTLETHFGPGHPGNPEDQWVLLAPCHFTATPTDGQQAIISASIEVTRVPLPDPATYVARNWRGAPRGEGHGSEADEITVDQIKVTVSSWIDGVLTGPVGYHWMCTVEVGILYMEIG